MIILTVTAPVRVTFRKDVLKHLGIRPGGRILFDLSPDGRSELKADQPSGSWRALQGLLKGKRAGVRLSIEDINDEIAKAGASAGRSGLDGQ